MAHLGEGPTANPVDRASQHAIICRPRGHWTTRRSRSHSESTSLCLEDCSSGWSRNDCDGAGERWGSEGLLVPLAPSVSAERPNELAPEGHEGQQGRAKPQPEREECDDQDESHWRPPTAKCRPRGEGRVALAGWIRLPLAARALTANLTAKRTDADGNSALGRTPELRLS